MRRLILSVKLFLLVSFSCLICSCTSAFSTSTSSKSHFSDFFDNFSPGFLGDESMKYAHRLPQNIDPPFEKMILVDPNVHAWGAYGPSGNLIRAGMATAGSDWCSDLGQPCRTRSGTFRVNFLGSFNCKSTKFPMPYGGAPMPYCMFFNGDQALHGSYDVVDGNVSHGCVRLEVEDARWLRFNFINVGTKVVVRSY
ncbi:MAG: L,D-transpeptidase [Gammaproteobacteria bacterium]